MIRFSVLKKTYLSFLSFVMPVAITLLMFLLMLVWLSTWIGFSAEEPKIFPTIEGWNKTEKILTFFPENLFDYINGAAELYLSYDFQQLKVAEYSSKNSEASVLIEIYRHKTPVHAFGIYSQERPTEGSFLDIGAQAYLEGTVLNFIAGEYYMKLNCYDAGAETSVFLKAFAQKIAENLNGKASLPRILSIFPEKGKQKNSEKFIAVNFLGYSFLRSAFIADYEDSNNHFTLFIIEGVDSKECEEMLAQYLNKTKSSQKEVKENRYILSDPYHGDIALSWKGKYIWGVLNLAKSSSQKEYMSLFEEQLRKENLIK